jgi:GxxExxY protein
MAIIYKEESYAIMGACFEVYKEMGSGFLEAVYQECLEIELGLQNIPFEPQASLLLEYKKRSLKGRYIPDFICFDKIILEIKAVSKLTDEHRAQVHNYLKATNYKLGLLVNFGHYPKVEYERIVRWSINHEAHEKKKSKKSLVFFLDFYGTNIAITNLDDMTVRRERELGEDIIYSREIVISEKNGLIRDRTYCIRLYSPEKISELMHSTGFSSIAFKKDFMRRETKGDYGCMTNRMIVTAEKHC